MKPLWPWLAAAASGVLLALSLPPFGCASLIWIALIPLLAAVWFTPAAGRWRPLRLLGLGYLAGLIYFWGAFSWLTEVTPPGWVLLGFYMASYSAVWALFVGIVCRPRDEAQWLHSFHNLRLAARGAAAWAGLEWVRGTLFTGFGWNNFGTALWRNTAVIQIVDITGVPGLTFLIVLVNFILLMTIKRVSLEVGRIGIRPHFDFTVTMGLVALTFGYGVYRINEPRPKSWLLNVAAVQANIPQDVKWDPAFEQHILDTYLRLSDNAIALKPDLLIWPEASTPRPLLDNEDIKAAVVGVLKKLRANFLLGSVRFFGPDAFNSAILLDPRGDIQVYDKMHLVPFGEYVPLRHSFPLFAWIVGDLVPGDFVAGTTPVVMTLAGKPYRVAPLICFEDTVGDLTRRFAQQGAELLITITNDGWFRKSAGSRQHLANAVFRCAETKLPLVRAANTGVTCFVDRFGHVDRTLEAGGSTFIEGILYGRIPIRLQPPQTFYTRYGELFALLCLGGAVLSVRTHLLTARRK